MNSLSDSFLSQMSTLLQWLAIIGTSLALIAAIAMLFVHNEISLRFEKRLIESNNNAARAKSVANELAKKQEPRKIEMLKRETLVSSLKEIPEKISLAIVYTQGNNESKNYAEELSAIFKAAGIITHVGWWAGDPLPIGISVGNRKSDFDGIASYILDSLKKGGIDAKHTRSAPVVQENINLLVGAKQ